MSEAVMHKAKAFFYVCAGLLLVALSAVLSSMALAEPLNPLDFPTLGSVTL